MNKYIILYIIDDYADNGGGLQSETFESSIELDKRVEEIMIQGHELFIAGEITEYKYKTVEVVKKVIRDDID